MQAGLAARTLTFRQIFTSNVPSMFIAFDILHDCVRELSFLAGVILTDQGQPEIGRGRFDLGLEVALAIEVGFQTVQMREELTSAAGQLAGHAGHHRTPGPQQAQKSFAEELFLGLGQISAYWLKECLQIGRYGLHLCSAFR